jgi:hypothetical protein
MKRFSFVTTSNPVYSGEGVDWEDGRATYRHKVGNKEFYAPSTGQVDDILFQYGGLPGYELTYEDE